MCRDRDGATIRGSLRAALSPSQRSPSRARAGARLRRLSSGARCARPRRIARQVGDQPVPRRKPVAAPVMVQELDLHPRHVDAGRAFAPAALARDAQIHRLAHVFRDERIGSELARQGQAQRVGAAAGQVLLVAGGAKGRAHHRGVALAAGAVVVAHLDRAGEAAPFRPVERGRNRQRPVVGPVAEQAAVVHLRGPHDLAGVEQARRDRTRP